MVHLQLCVVPLAVLDMFRGHMEVNVTQIPPSRETSAEINAPPAFSLALTIQNVGTGRIQHNRLYNTQSMSIDSKALLFPKLIKGASGIMVLHPMHINTLIVFVTGGNGSGAKKFNRTFMMVFTAVLSLWTPQAATALTNAPTLAVLKGIRIPRLE